MVFISAIERGISNALIEGINGRICRLRERTGIMFGPHTFRHIWAPELLRRGVAVEVAAQLSGHASIAPTGTPLHT